MYQDTVVSYLSFLSVCAFYSAALYWNAIRITTALEDRQRLHYMLLALRGYGLEWTEESTRQRTASEVVVSLEGWKRMRAARGWTHRPYGN